MSKHRRRKLRPLPIYAFKPDFDLPGRITEGPPRIFLVNMEKRLYKVVGLDDGPYFSADMKSAILAGTERWTQYTASDTMWLRVNRNEIKHIVHRAPSRHWYE